jgi:uncharacterized protein (DUF433 family)
MANERIEVNPAVLAGKPVIRGTRVPVELLLRKLADGATEAGLFDAYPRLALEDIYTDKRHGDWGSLDPRAARELRDAHTCQALTSTCTVY